jgi:hypothetical protein
LAFAIASAPSENCQPLHQHQPFLCLKGLVEAATITAYIDRRDNLDIGKVIFDASGCADDYFLSPALTFSREGQIAAWLRSSPASSPAATILSLSPLFPEPARLRMNI